MTRVRGITLARGAVVLCASLLCPSALGAQQRAGSKQAAALRVPDGSVQLDSRLDEAVWQRATPVTDFVQKEPDEGVDPSTRMEVRFVYEGSALYVGARMYGDPRTIQAPLGGRDQTADVAENVEISLDTFLDRRTAYTFGVTASGARLDHFHPQDQEDGWDDGFNPVWDARTHVDADGWTAEMWIPFTQLRFNDREQQVWGLNVVRLILHNREESSFTPMPREWGNAANFRPSGSGLLLGLNGLHPRRRVEVIPFLSPGVVRNFDAGTPTHWSDGYGGDVRIGLVDPRGADLDADGAPETFRSCTRQEGVHLTVWSGPALLSPRRWHYYYYLGNDVEPTCEEADYAG